MKKLLLFIIPCLLVSVTAWAGWSKPNPQSKQLYSKLTPSVCCSADGKTVYLTYNSFVASEVGFGAIIMYKSVDGGETWSEQIMSPALNPANSVSGK
jgi:hypothetical protein